MTNTSPKLVPSRRPGAKKAHPTVSATLAKAHAKALSVDVDAFFYSPIVRSNGAQPLDDDLLKELTNRSADTNIRLDFIVGDQCRFTKVGNRS